MGYAVYYDNAQNENIWDLDIEPLKKKSYW